MTNELIDARGREGRARDPGLLELPLPTSSVPRDQRRPLVRVPVRGHNRITHDRSQDWTDTHLVELRPERRWPRSLDARLILVGDLASGCTAVFFAQ